MGTLDSYLSGEYESDKTQCRILDDLIKDVLIVLSKFWDRTKKSWPYRVRHQKGPDPIDDISISTHTMILFALEATFGSDAKSTPLFPTFTRSVGLSKEEGDDIKAIRKEAPKTLDSELKSAINAGSAPLVESSTFGKDDPFTLTWLTELCVHRSGNFISLKDAVERAGKRVLDRMKKEVFLEWKDGANEIASYAFLQLRGIHLAKAQSALAGGTLEYCTEKDQLEKTIHRQLAYSVIPDSRYDPAELTFAFEGLLQLDALLLSSSMLNRILSVLEESQQRNAYWRPTTPVFGTEKGMVLFPVSVEVANSLVRANALLKAHNPNIVSRIEPLVRRYFQWLQARLERLEFEGKPFVGWHSEHINRSGEIHLWETSQVLIFLVQYRSMLQEKIAIEGLRAAGLRPKPSKNIKFLTDFWRDDAISGLPIGSPYRVLASIKSQYLDPILAKKAPESRSVLLYGPPGTGKTTVAEQLASTIKWPLLTITVSDFLAGGAAEVEARAKGIFQVLCEQKDLVILFDEIDQFLLDRNSEDYKNQVGIFQFMTPGMLTKLAALREEENCIFIVATNYEERIDSAIKRPGRFDERRLMTLPGKSQRLEFLKRFISERVEDRVNVPGVEGAAEELSKKTRYFGFGDLKQLVKVANIGKSKTRTEVEDALTKALDQVPPSVKLSSYSGRFSRGQGPFEEFFVLLHQLAELDQKPDSSEVPSIASALRQAGKKGFSGYVLEARIRKKLGEWKKKRLKRKS